MPVCLRSTSCGFSCNCFSVSGFLRGLQQLEGSLDSSSVLLKFFSGHFLHQHCAKVLYLQCDTRELNPVLIVGI